MRIFDKYIFFIFSLFFLILPCRSTLASDAITLRDKDILAFADHLYRGGEYYRAISEYQRLIYYFPENESVSFANLQIGRAYMAGGELREAIRHWESELEKKSQKKNFLTINSLLGISWLDLDRAKTFTLRLDHLKNAKKYFSRVKGEVIPNLNVQMFFNDWKQLPPLEKKSSWIAGGLSTILPGSGSFYTGRPLEGSYAFIITGLFYLATKDAFLKKQQELGVLFGFFTLSFYGGNIYTAINGAHKFNDYQRAQQLETIRKSRGIWFIPQSNTNTGRF